MAPLIVRQFDSGPTVPIPMQARLDFFTPETLAASLIECVATLKSLPPEQRTLQIVNFAHGDAIKAIGLPATLAQMLVGMRMCSAAWTRETCWPTLDGFAYWDLESLLWMGTPDACANILRPLLIKAGWMSVPGIPQWIANRLGNGFFSSLPAAFLRPRFRMANLALTAVSVLNPNSTTRSLAYKPIDNGTSCVNGTRVNGLPWPTEDMKANVTACKARGYTVLLLGSPSAYPGPGTWEPHYQAGAESGADAIAFYDSANDKNWVGYNKPAAVAEDLRVAQAFGVSA